MSLLVHVSGAAQPIKSLFTKLLFFLLLASSGGAFAQWTRKADEISKRAEANNALYHNKLYVFGGFGDNPVIEKTNEVYDIATNKWSQIASFPAGKEITHNGVILVDDNVWIIGGRAVDAHGPVSSQVIIYNITTNTWSDGPQIIDPSTGQPFPLGAGGYTLIGRTIHVFGGFGPTICEDQSTLHLTLDVDKYNADPNGTTWENKSAPLPIPRNHISYVTLGGKIYAFGGQFKHDCGAVDQKYCHVYDPQTDTWTRLTDLPIVRSHAEAATFAVDGKIFLVAGQGVNNVTQNTVYEFNPKANNGLGSWTNLANYKLPGSFLGLSSKLSGSRFIITNGALNNYANERKETYIANVTRATTRTLGFGAPCLSLNANTGDMVVGDNLLYVIEDTTQYHIISNESWLNVTKNGSGTATLNGQVIEVTADATNLAGGNYTGQIKATCTKTGSTATFCVNLTVTSSSPSGFTLTIDTTGKGTVSINPNKSTYAAGSNVVLNATPNAGYKFNKWSGDTTSSSNPLTVTINSNKQIIANFIQNDSAVTLITNIKSVTANSYQLGALSAGSTYYTDRNYQLTSVPSYLNNAPFIKTANDDKANKSNSALSFTLNAAATVYVAFDPRSLTLPAWLNGWQKVTDRVGINDPLLSYFALFSKTFPAGNVTLGGDIASPASGVRCQYIVIANSKADSSNLMAATEAKSLFLPTDTTTKHPTDKIRVYPNPSHGIFKILLPQSSSGVEFLRIADMNGFVQNISGSLYSSSGKTLSVDLSSLSLRPGLYGIDVISTQGKIYMVRVIIQ